MLQKYETGGVERERKERKRACGVQSKMREGVCKVSQKEKHAMQISKAHASLQNKHLQKEGSSISRHARARAAVMAGSHGHAFFFVHCLDKNAQNRLLKRQRG